MTWIVFVPAAARPLLLPEDFEREPHATIPSDAASRHAAISAVHRLPELERRLRAMLNPGPAAGRPIPALRLPGILNPVAGELYVFAGTGGSTFGVYGGSATDLTLSNASQIGFDAAGDVYILDSGAYGVLQGYIDKVDVKGIATLVVGDSSLSNCAASPDGFGDGCAANQVWVAYPTGMVVAPDGDLYYADGNLMHRVVAGTTNPALTTTAGLASSQTVQVSNVGTQTLQLTGITESGAGACGVKDKDV